MEAPIRVKSVIMQTDTMMEPPIPTVEMTCALGVPCSALVTFYAIVAAGIRISPTLPTIQHMKLPAIFAMGKKEIGCTK